MFRKFLKDYLPSADLNGMVLSQQLLFLFLSLPGLLFPHKKLTYDFRNFRMKLLIEKSVSENDAGLLKFQQLKRQELTCDPNTAPKEFQNAGLDDRVLETYLNTGKMAGNSG
jgi:hypothetical protein